MSDELEFTDSARGCGIVLGLASIVVNGGMTFAGVVVVARGQLGGIALAIPGAAGVLFGLVLAFVRYRGHLDRARRVLVKSWRVVFEVRRRETSLDGYDAVALRANVGRTRYSWYRYHTIALVGPAGEQSLRRVDLEPDAEAFAREVAAFLGWPIRDERKPTAQLIAERPRLSTRRRGLIIALTMLVALLLAGAAAAIVALQRHEPPRRKR